MAELVILGSGAGFATADRFSTSIALLVERTTYVFDCGEPCAALMFRNGIDPLSVRAIFVSHMHPDHVGGLAPLLFSIYLPGRSTAEKFRPWSIHRGSDWYRSAINFPAAGGVEETVSLIIPGEAISPITSYLPAVYLAPSILPFKLEVSPVVHGPTYADELISVDGLPNTHLSANSAYEHLPRERPGMELQSYSFAIRVADRTIVYSGDITRLSELDPLVSSADVVILEVAHFDPEDLAGFASRIPAKRIVLTHVHPGLERRLIDLVEEWGDPRISIAHDGFRLSIL